MVCKNCGKYIPDDSEECPFCGTDSPKVKTVKIKKRSEFKICPKCGYKNSYKEYNCKSCNFDLSLSVPTAKEERIGKAKKSGKTIITGIFLLICSIACIYLIFCIISFFSGDKNNIDGKCDICHKPSVCTINGEEYCEKHAYEAGAYYLDLE